jgi:MFS family permease
MASSSALVIPLGIFLIGTRLWALGKRHGFMTPVQMFRDRWECGHIGHGHLRRPGVLLVPYIVIAVMGGGTTLRAVSNGLVPFWLGGAVVSLVVMGYVFFGGMRGTAWVNTFQTVLFLSFGAIAVVGDRARHGRIHERDGSRLLASPSTAPLLTAERVSPLYFLSYTFIPLSSIAFPHIGIFCLTAKRLSHFRGRSCSIRSACSRSGCRRCSSASSPTGGGRAGDPTQARSARDAAPPRPALDAERAPSCAPRQRRRRDPAAGRRLRAAVARGAPRRARDGGGDGERLADPGAVDDVHRGRVRVLRRQARFGQPSRCRRADLRHRADVVAYAIALRRRSRSSTSPASTRSRILGAGSPLLVAALFWKNSTKWGALAVALWTAAAVAGGVLQSRCRRRRPDAVPSGAGGTTVIARSRRDDRLGCCRSSDDVVSRCSDVSSCPLVHGGRPGAATLANTDVKTDGETRLTRRVRRSRLRVRLLRAADAAADRAPGAGGTARVPATDPRSTSGSATCSTGRRRGRHLRPARRLPDRLFGRRRVLTWSILLYAFSAFAAGYSTSVYQLLFWRCCTFVGVCVEFVAAVAWLAELFPTRSSASGHRLHAGVRIARRPHGHGRLLPRGHLRASLPASRRARAWRYTLMSGSSRRSR